ncbi:MAG: UDP-N-acetylglucosamine 2-epimerase, partial [Eubacterium sp.]
EEMNRQMVGVMSDLNFCPTSASAQNLLNEGKKKDSIYITGNTAIDAMETTINPTYYHPLFDWIGDDRMLLLTAHRRENLGEPMYHIFKAIRRIVESYKDVKVIYPI